MFVLYQMDQRKFPHLFHLKYVMCFRTGPCRKHSQAELHKSELFCASV